MLNVQNLSHQVTKKLNEIIPKASRFIRAYNITKSGRNFCDEGYFNVDQDIHLNFIGLGARLLRIWPLSVDDKFDHAKLNADIEQKGSSRMYPEVEIRYTLLGSGSKLYQIEFLPTIEGLNFLGKYRFDKFLPKVSKIVKTFELVRMTENEVKKVGIFNVNQDIPVQIVSGDNVSFEAKPIN